MRADAIAGVAQTDPLIVCLGNEWMIRNVRNKVNRRYYTSAVMRLVARVKMTLNGENENRPLKEYLCAKYFQDVCAAVMKTSIQDEEAEEEFEAPSNAVKLKFDLNRLGNIKLGKAIMSGNKEEKVEAEEFLQLMKIKWSDNLAKVALMNRKLNVRKPLPLPEDVKKLAEHINSELNNFDYNDISYSSYRRAVTVAIAKLVSFNRRRCGEVQAIL